MKTTKYRSIYNDLLYKIKNRIIKENESLSSTRELAQIYQSHRFTVMRVCQDLQAEGWLTCTEKTRYQVSQKIPILESHSLKAKASKAKLTQKLTKLTQPIVNIDLERTRYKIEFWGGQPDLRLFPKDEYRRVLSSALKRAKPDDLNYGHVDGLPHCIKEVSAYLRRSRGLQNKEFIMTNGSQEAIYLALQTFTKSGDAILVERKGYPPAWHLFKSLGLKIIPVEIDSEGLVTDDLLEKIKKHSPKMIYTTPLHQYPTTVTLSPRRRQLLIKIAEKFTLPIIEDDYDHEYHFTKLPPTPLAAETPMAIYICSFSKVLFPGARLGVIGFEPRLKPNISQQKYLISRQTDCLTQIGLTAWIKDGGFEQHLRRTRRIYQLRRDFMIDQLNALKADHKINWNSPHGGMSIWVNFSKNSKLIADRCKAKGIFFQHESSMDFMNSVGHHLRIGFAGVNEDEIKTGFSILKSNI